MKMVKETKFFRKQAEKAERMALSTSDEEASQNLSNLAQAYRSQADALKKNKKLKKSKKISGKKAPAEGEEMTAPGPAWSDEEEELLRSLAAAGESVVAIATLLKRSHHAVRKRADLLEIKLARSLPGPKPKWK
jgi:hypothetical protein